MIIKEITYKNFNGEEVTEKLYFHLSKLERLRMEAKYKDGIEAEAQRIADENDRAGMLRLLEDVVSSAYGVRSDDGMTFVKNDEIKSKFMNSEAYSETIMSLLEAEDPSTTVSDFFKGIIGANA